MSSCVRVKVVRSLRCLRGVAARQETRRDRYTQNPLTTLKRKWRPSTLFFPRLFKGCIWRWLFSQETMMRSPRIRTKMMRFFLFFLFFLATTVQFLQPQFICIAAAKRLSIFVSEQEEWAITDWHGDCCDEAVYLGATPRQLLKSLLVIKRNIKKSSFLLCYYNQILFWVSYSASLMNGLKW